MSKRGENIHKRKDGRWESRVIIKDIAGNSKYYSLYGKTYKEVKDKKENFIKENNYNLKKRPSITFGDVLAIWLENKFFRHKESTRLKYSNIINTHILPILGALDIKQIDDVVINQFLNSKKEAGRLDGQGGLSNSYVKTMAIIINSAMNYAAEKEMCLPMKASIQKPSVAKTDIHVLTPEMQQKFEDLLQLNDSLTALGVLIALNTGLRIGELCALKWEDIDMAQRTIHVKHSVIRVLAQKDINAHNTELVIGLPKTKTSIRDIPITTKLFTILAKAGKVSDSKFVVSDSVEFVSPRTFEYRFHQILAQYGIPDTNFHTLRHTFATRCVEKNVDIKTLSEVLGHSNVGITLNTYVHPSFDVKRQQLEKLCEPCLYVVNRMV